VARESPAAWALRGRLIFVADRKGHVLVHGPSGAGKELVARAVHQCSPRTSKTYISRNAATLPVTLLDAELFGNARNYPNPGMPQRTGLVGEADGGTLFLDEFAELPIEAQAHMLRVLDQGEYTRLGEARPRVADIRLLAATNRPLEQFVAEGRFRADLYYRLKVLALEMPRLARRGDDVTLLANHFAAATARRFGLPEPTFTDAARAALRAYSWPGNVRELAHVVERALLLNSGAAIGADALLLSPAAAGGAANAGSLQELEGMSLQDVEILLIRRALQRTGGNVSRAARELGITRMALRYRIKQHQIATP